MIDLIEQRQAKLIDIGGSKYALIPIKWVEEIGVDENTTIIIRLCRGKKGKFIDLYKQE